VTNDNSPNEADGAFPERQLLQSQLEQSKETWRWQIGLLAQVFTVLVVAHISFIGYAFTTKRAGIMMIGALFPLVFFVIIRIANRLAVPAVYTAIAVENKFLETGVDGLMTTTIGVIISEEQISRFRTVCSEPEFNKRIGALRNMRFSVLGKNSRLIECILIANAIGQIVMASCLLLWLCWSFF